jgi:hypothetical protein
MMGFSCARKRVRGKAAMSLRSIGAGRTPMFAAEGGSPGPALLVALTPGAAV